MLSRLSSSRQQPAQPARRCKTVCGACSASQRPVSLTGNLGTRAYDFRVIRRHVDYPAAPFAQKVFRFSLTPTFLRNRIIWKFRHLRRDSRSVVHGPFLEQLSAATSAKRAVRPRFCAPAGPNLLSDPTDCAPKTAAVPRHNTRARFASCEDRFCFLKEENTKCLNKTKLSSVV